MTQYPGPDPDDPFAKQPKEQGASQPTPETGAEETAPIQREELGYWEKLAQEQSAQGDQPPAAPPSYEQNPTSAQPSQPSEQNPWGGYGEPAGADQSATPPPPPAAPYGTPPPASPYGAPPPSPYGYGQYPAAYVVPSHPQSTTALVLGLIGLVGGCVCYLPALVAPFAWWIGAKAKREIAASNGQLGGQGNAQAGFVMGIIGTVLLVLVLLFIGFFIVLGVTGNLDSSSSYSTEF